MPASAAATSEMHCEGVRGGRASSSAKADVVRDDTTSPFGRADTVTCTRTGVYSNDNAICHNSHERWHPYALCVTLSSADAVYKQNLTAFGNFLS